MKKKHAFDKESDQEKKKGNTLSTKKAIKKERKHGNGHAKRMKTCSRPRKKKTFFLFFLFSCFLS